MDSQNASQTLHTMEDIERIKAALEAAPVPVRPLSKQETLDKLAPALKTAQAKGHTLQSLVDMLAQQGLRTHVRAVSSAIARLGAAKPARQMRSSRTPAANLPSTASAQA